jgi:hypothetical protein
MDTRILPLNKFDLDNDLYCYFLDCVFGTLHFLFEDKSCISINNINDTITNIDTNNNIENTRLDILLSFVLNKTFNNQTCFLNDNKIDINHLLISIIDIVTIADFNSHSMLLCNSFFMVIFSLTKLKIQSNEYLDSCILNDIANCLIDHLGRMNQTNTVKLSFALTEDLVFKFENEINIFNIKKSYHWIEKRILYKINHIFYTQYTKIG